MGQGAGEEAWEYAPLRHNGAMAQRHSGAMCKGTCGLAVEPLSL